MLNNFDSKSISEYILNLRLQRQIYLTDPSYVVNMEDLIDHVNNELNVLMTLLTYVIIAEGSCCSIKPPSVSEEEKEKLIVEINKLKDKLRAYDELSMIRNPQDWRG